MLIDTIKQDLKNAIDKDYQEMDSENTVTIISQMITDKVCHRRHYLLANYSLKNECFYHPIKLYLSNKDSLHFCVPQESYN